MAARDLGMRAVVEAVLDAKGFEEFKKRVVEAGRQAGESGKGASQAGKHFNELGKRLPTASFKIMADEMLHSAGIMGQTRVLSNLLEDAMMGLASAGKLTSTVWMGATLGIGLLVPLLLSMRKGTDDVKESTVQVTSSADGWIEKLENIKKKTGELTLENQALLDSLLALQRAEKERDLGKTLIELEALKKKYHEQALEHINTNRLVGEQAQQFLALADASATADPAIRTLREREKQLRGELDGTRKSLEDQSRAADALAASLKRTADAAADAARNQAEFLEKADKESLEVQEALRRGAEEDRNNDFMAFLKREEKKREEGERTEKERAKLTDEAERRVLENEVRISKTIDQARAARERQFRRTLDMQVQAYRKAGMSEVEIAKFVASEKLRFASEEREFELRAADERIQAEMMVAQAAADFLAYSFGENKAAAYAAALVNIALGVTKALSAAPPPFNIALAAITAAAGAVQLAAIQKANYGRPGGFDDPVSDLMAERMGQKWAEDLIRHANAGFYGRMNERPMFAGGAGSITYDNRKNVNVGGIHLGGFFGRNEREMKKKIYREIVIDGERFEDLTRVGSR